jgi:hypothetical protein
VGVTETNTREPLRKGRKRRDALETRGESFTWEKPRGRPAYWRGGGRHGGGVHVTWAAAWNGGTWRPEAQGARPVAVPQAAEDRSGAQGRTRAS